LTEIVLWNIDRLSLIWPSVQNGLFEVLREATKPSFRVELACVGFCRVFSKVRIIDDGLISPRRNRPSQRRSPRQRVSRSVYSAW